MKNFLILIGCSLGSFLHAQDKNTLYLITVTDKGSSNVITSNKKPPNQECPELKPEHEIESVMSVSVFNWDEDPRGGCTYSSQLLPIYNFIGSNTCASINLEPYTRLCKDEIFAPDSDILIRAFQYKYQNVGTGEGPGVNFKVQMGVRSGTEFRYFFSSSSAINPQPGSRILNNQVDIDLPFLLIDGKKREGVASYLAQVPDVPANKKPTSRKFHD